MTGVWPKSKLMRHGPELPMAERIRRYQHNIRAIRASGCRVPTVAMPDTLDPAEIEAWFKAKQLMIARVGDLIRKLSRLPADALMPSPFLETLHHTTNREP